KPPATTQSLFPSTPLFRSSGTDIRVFSRLMNDVTAAVPEVVEAARALGFEDAILDGEAIALDAGGRPLPFQSTMRRFGRKLDVRSEEHTSELQSRSDLVCR